MTRGCKGVKGDGTPCRCPPSRDSSYCLAHDPTRKAEHAAISQLGGVARHDPEVSAVKAEIRDVKAALWSGKVSPGAASVLLQAIRLEREVDADDRLNDSVDEFITSIQTMRESGDVPDMSEDNAATANDRGGGWSSGVAGLIDPDEPDEIDGIPKPRLEDYADADAYLTAVRAWRADPLGSLSVAERRKRWASGQRWGKGA